MAHELEIENGAANAFFGGNVPAWHGLGTVIPEDVVTTEEALVLAGLDFEVVKVPARIILPSGAIVEPDRKYHTVRDPNGPREKFLGDVGEKYRVFNNQQAFAFGDAMVDNHGAKWHTAGSLHDGRKAWMLMKLPQDVLIGGEQTEAVQPFICFQNSHDGSSAVTMFTTFVRVVCQNTLTWALSGTTRKFSIRHTGNFDDPAAMASYVAQAQEKLGVVFDLLAQMEREGAAMMQQGLSDDGFDAMLTHILPGARESYKSERAEKTAESIRNRKRDLLFDYFRDSPNLANVRGTKWGALQAVIEVNDHRHAERDFGVNSREDVRFDRIIDGGGLVQSAYDYLIGA
jgi:phage/plasmid-like protein (TIGR03299 family)